MSGAFKGRQLIIADIDRQIAVAELALKLGKRDAAKAFPGLLGEGKLAKLSMPTAVLQTFLRWLWLSWHDGTSYNKVRVTARLVVERSIEAIKIAPQDEMRPQHDIIALLASILSGDVELIRKMAQMSVSANPSSRAKQFYESWAGIFKARVLDKREDEMIQLAIFKKNKGLGLFSEPSSSSATAFCERDYATLSREIGKAVERTYHEAQGLGAIDDSGIGEVRLLLARGNTLFRFRWPWPEAAFAKLAILEGASMDFDGFWLPKHFIADWIDR